MRLKSALGDIAWPAIQTGRAAELVALQRQFDATQWWTPEKLQSFQFEQLTKLVEHAYANVPFHRERLSRIGYSPGMAMTPALWSRLPVLTRTDVRDHAAELTATSYPSSFGKTMEATTGGSSGIPIRVKKTGLENLLMEAMYVRFITWHCESVERPFLSLKTPTDVRSLVRKGEGLFAADWRIPASLIWKTGPMGFIDPKTHPGKVAAFISAFQPAYLHCLPSTLRLLVSHCLDNGIRLPSLQSVWTQSEMVDEALREKCQQAWGCRIIDNYSAAETGSIAIQCPHSTHMHVMHETQLVEILNDDGVQCRPGEIGRVVITPLHGYAAPLFRYELGDEAIVADGCSCGRGLTALRKIIGRTGDFAVLQDGSRRRATMDHYGLSKILAVREFQLAQLGFDLLELRLVVSRALDGKEVEIARSAVTSKMGQDFRVTIRYVDQLPRTAAGKLRPFVKEMDHLLQPSQGT